MGPRLPNLFIVGAPKCGTTALHQYLDAHPEIYMSKWKEPHFFAPEHAWRDFTLQDYLQLFEGAGDAKWAGEGSTHYLVVPDSASAIHAFSPDAKIIIMLRAPHEMLYSLYFQRLKTGNEVLPNFAEALAAEEERRQGNRIPPGSKATQLQYRDYARFTEQVRRFFDAFGREAVHIIIYDDFKADTARAYRDTLNFLGVDPNFTTNFEAVNQNVRARSRILNQLLWRPPEWVRRAVPVYQALMPNALRLSIRRKLLDMNSVPAPRPPLDPALRQQLQREFAPEIEALSELLGRDLTHWCKEA